MEKELITLRTRQLKAEGDSHSSSATVQRLQAQINGHCNEIKLLMTAKSELEQSMKVAKADLLECEASRDDVYK